MATFEEKVLESLARIEEKLKTDKTASEILEGAAFGNWNAPAPAPKPAPKGKITYPPNNGKVIARIPMYFAYEGDGSPDWFTSTSQKSLGHGGQVALILPSTGAQVISAVVDEIVVDQITVIAEEPGPR